MNIKNDIKKVKMIIKKAKVEAEVIAERNTQVEIEITMIVDLDLIHDIIILVLIGQILDLGKVMIMIIED